MFVVCTLSMKEGEREMDREEITGEREIKGDRERGETGETGCSIRIRIYEHYSDYPNNS